jgi:hypothetical protein
MVLLTVTGQQQHQLLRHGRGVRALVHKPLGMMALPTTSSLKKIKSRASDA